MARIRRQAESGAGKVIVLLIVGTLVVIMSIQIANLYQKNRVYMARQEELAQALEEETEKRQELEAYEAYTKTPDYVEDIAKSKLGLVHENEIVFKEAK